MLARLLISWVILTVALLATARVTEWLGLGFRADPSDVPRLLLGAAVLGLVNATLGRFLKLLTLPLACLTFGLSCVLINTFLIWMVGRWGLGFEVDGFWPALIGSVLFSAFSGVLARALKGSPP